MAGKADITGHSDEIAQLKDDLSSGNIAHAYLFSGPDHVGKMSLAKWFATELLLTGVSDDKKENVENEIDRLLHPDLLVLDQLWMEEVMEDWDEIAKSSNVSQIHRSKKPAAKTDTISIDDVRALQQRLYETGTGTYRCCIVRGVERMQDAAANAFLKILEEPPQNLVFILTTESESLILPTVRSRTRIIRFKRVGRNDLKPLLKGVAEDDAQFILHLAQGAPGVACTLRDHPDILRSHRMVQTKARSFWKASSLRERLQLLEPLQERGEDADGFLLHLFLALRETDSLMLQLATPLLSRLQQGLETNAHRGLLIQQFVYNLEKTANQSHTLA